MRKIFRLRNLFLLLLSLPLVLFAGYLVEFTYRTNGCAPGDHVLQSEADAIEVVKRKFIQNPSVPLLTDDSQIGANLRFYANEENRADFDQRG